MSEEKKIRRFATGTLKGVLLSFENANGERITEEFTVKFRSYSHQMHQQMELMRTDGAGIVPYWVALSIMVESIVDQNGEPLTNDNGDVADLSGDFFSTIPIEDAKRLQELIHDAVFPPKASLEPGPSGSNGEESEA